MSTVESFDRFVDRYIETVLQAAEHVEREEPIDPQQTHAKLLSMLTKVQRFRHYDQTWEAAIYALTSWTDDLMIEMPWKGRNWWNDHVLETNLFGTRECSERFFVLAGDAANRHDTTALRVFHDCVLLGFRGVYAWRDTESMITDLPDLPQTLDLWLADVRKLLAAEQQRNTPAAVHRTLSGAAPQRFRSRVIWWSLTAAVLLLLNLSVYSLFLRA